MALPKVKAAPRTGVNGDSDEATAKLIVDNVATSPFDEYPGTITFDGSFNPKRYRKFTEAIKAQDDDAMSGFLSQASYRGLWAMQPVVTIDGLVRDFDKCTVNVQVIRWAVEVALEYCGPFLIDSPWR